MLTIILNIQHWFTEKNHKNQSTNVSYDRLFLDCEISYNNGQEVFMVEGKSINNQSWTKISFLIFRGGVCCYLYFFIKYYDH